MVQWLRVCASTAGGIGLSLVGELKSHMLRGTVEKKRKKKQLSMKVKMIYSFNLRDTEMQALALEVFTQKQNRGGSWNLRCIYTTTQLRDR